MTPYFDDGMKDERDKLLKEIKEKKMHLISMHILPEYERLNGFQKMIVKWVMPIFGEL